MPKINFPGISDIDDFSPLPSGTYLCRVEDVEEAVTKYGDEMWKLKLVVLDGSHVGRQIFDNMVFSDKAQKRVKHICSGLGLNVGSEVDLEPSSIMGRSCYVTVEIRDYMGNDGTARKSNVVLFGGYKRASGAGPQSQKAPPF